MCGFPMPHAPCLAHRGCFRCCNLMLRPPRHSVSPSPRLPVSPSSRLPVSPSPRLPVFSSPRLPVSPSPRRLVSLSHHCFDSACTPSERAGKCAHSNLFLNSHPEASRPIPRSNHPIQDPTNRSKIQPTAPRSNQPLQDPINRSKIQSTIPRSNQSPQDPLNHRKTQPTIPRTNQSYKDFTVALATVKLGNLNSRAVFFFNVLDNFNY